MPKFFLHYAVLIIAVFSFSFQNEAAAERVIKKGDSIYLSNQIVIKTKESVQSDFTGKAYLPYSISQKLSFLQIKEASFLLKSIKSKINHPAEQIIIISYSADIDPLDAISILAKDNSIEWAEPKFIYEPTIIPNDPDYSQQWYLPKVKADLAWDISLGDTSVVIGIVDTGVDWDHPDLAANIWRNWNEIPNNGIDDDNNGFIDDIRGWDFGGLTGTADNDPMEDRPDHGTHVAGIASAVTNNGIGVAGLGYKCKIMPVKATRDNYRNASNQPYIVYGYEGIAYAAANGAKVINNSWGGSGYSIAGQIMIDYATSLGALVVCAAGNNNSNALFYPASYDNVISVAATGTTDVKASFSNFGLSVDVSSPGLNMRSTWQNNTYASLQGTSMASPLVAGLAGLVASHFPTLTPIQIGERIRVTSDNIDLLNTASLRYMLGYGRINAFNALSVQNPKSIRIKEFIVSDVELGNGDGIFQQNEILTVRFKGKNILSPVSNPTFELFPSGTASTVLGVTGSLAVGALATGADFSTDNGYFRIRISPTASQNQKVDIRLEIKDGTYTDYQWLSFIANPTYSTTTVNNVAMTITSKGALGYNDFPNNLQGSGFKYKGSGTLLFEGAFMFGNSATRVSDVARSANSLQSTDFHVVKPFVMNSPGAIADQQGIAIFNDNGAGVNKLNVETHLNSYSYSSEQNADYNIIEYKLVNKGTETFSNFHAGLYFDWDLPEADYANNIAAYDNINNFGYVYNTAGASPIRTGIALISHNKYNYYAIHNAGSDGGVSVNDPAGYTDAERWTTLSNGLIKTFAGPADISNVVAGGPYVLSPNDTLKIAFAIGAADDSTKLKLVIINSRTKYQQILTSANEESDLLPLEFELSQNYPNPFNPVTVIKYGVRSKEYVVLKVYDLLGREAAVLVNEEKPAGKYSVTFDAAGLASGVYFYRLSVGEFVAAKKLILMK